LNKGLTKALLIATGYNPKLRPLIQHRPSPLIKVVDKYIIIHIIEYLAKQGISQFEIVLHYLPQMIESALGDGSRWGVQITFHLSRYPEHPFVPIKPAAETWGTEKILLGRGDSLPKFNKQFFHLQEDGIVFLDSEKHWNGWGIVPADCFAHLPLETTLQSLPSQMQFPLQKIETKTFLSTRTFHEILLSNIRFITETSLTGLYPTGAHCIEPGVWISPSVSLHPGVKIQPPIFIGRNSQIKEGVQLGPNAIIESYCIIDRDSQIKQALICQRSYVGESLHIVNELVDKNLLVNFSHGSVLKIREDFILSELSTPHPLDRLVKWLEQFFALVLIAVLSPIYFLMKISCEIKKTEVLQLPTEFDSNQWKTFQWLQFSPRDEKPANFFQSFFLRLPALFNILHGEAHFIGSSPRTIQELRNLPSDWQKLYLKSKVGLITLDQLENKGYNHPNDRYAAEAYYAVNMGIFYDIKLLFRWLKQKLFGRRRGHL
jgi:NDP-sugar pyrophosphorylase family protein